MTMTRQQKLDFIRAKCVSANESILDLKMGCKVRYQTAYCKYVCESCAGNPIISFGFMTKTVKKKDLEIIGRKLRLSDLLLALEKNKFFSKNYDDVPYLIEGVKLTFWLHSGEEAFAYNLKTDDIELQSDELVDQVFNLLGGI